MVNNIDLEMMNFVCLPVFQDPDYNRSPRFPHFNRSDGLSYFSITIK